MFELSPLDTAAKASARSMPASMQHVAVEAHAGDGETGEVRPEAAERVRVLVDDRDGVAALSRLWAMVEPTRPQPMITMCTLVLRRSVRRRRAYRRDSDGAVHRRRATRTMRLTSTDQRRTARWPYPSVVANPTSVLKRLLVGRPFRSDRLQHTLLPKRIALPVFASDALSSVAYAPDEILLTLSIAGAGGVLLLAVGRAGRRRGDADGGRELPAERARVPVRRRRLRGGHASTSGPRYGLAWPARCWSTTC